MRRYYILYVKRAAPPGGSHQMNRNIGITVTELKV